MKIIVFAPFGQARGHHETDLEFTLDFLDKGNDVYFVQCAGDLSVCDVNTTNALAGCKVCKSWSDRSLDLIGFSKNKRLTLKGACNTTFPTLPKFANIDELKAFTWNNLPVGEAIASSLLCITRDTNPDMVVYESFVTKSIQMFIAVYGKICGYIDEIKPDAIYLFNGRPGVMNAAFCAGKAKGLEIFVGERDTFDRYVVFKNAIATDLVNLKKQLLSFKEKMENDPNGVAIAEGWFNVNRWGTVGLLCNWPRVQKSGALPAGFDPKKRNICYMQSSEDEVAAMPFWVGTLYKTQTELIQSMIQEIKDPSFHFYVRCHPNLIGLDNTQTRMFKHIKASNVTLIPPDSSIDSYALLEACEKTVAAISTMGIEAAYWNKPSILAGKAQYEDTGAVYVPKTREELLQMIQADLPPLGREKALAYGYWQQKRGVNLKFISPQDPRDKTSETRFNGVKLGPRKSTIQLLRVRSLLGRIANRFIRVSKSLSMIPQRTMD